MRVVHLQRYLVKVVNFKGYLVKVVHLQGYPPTFSLKSARAQQLTQTEVVEVVHLGRSKLTGEGRVAVRVCPSPCRYSWTFNCIVV